MGAYSKGSRKKTHILQTILKNGKMQFPLKIEMKKNVGKFVTNKFLTHALKAYCRLTVLKTLINRQHQKTEIATFNGKKFLTMERKILITKHILYWIRSKVDYFN